jgi:hypothetical protein
VPSDAIRPPRRTGDRTLARAVAFPQRGVTWARLHGTSGAWLDFAEIGAVARLIEGPAPRMRPFLQGRTGILVLQMPETTREAGDRSPWAE